MAVSDDEIESLRYHLGYGNVDSGGYPYTPDGFLELFRHVIQPNLTSGAETTASTSASAGNSTVTVGSLTDIAANARLVVDVGDAAEIVVVRSTGVLTFSAVFANAQTAPYTVAVRGGEQRLRLLLHRADASWQAMQSGDVGDVAGIKRIEGDVEWFPGGDTLKGRERAYRSIQFELSRLVRVPVADSGCGGQLEVY